MTAPAPPIAALPEDCETLCIIGRDARGVFASVGVAGVTVLRLGNSWLVSFEEVDPAPAAAAARAELERRRGEAWENDQDLFSDGTGWGK
jgi:hypothetical protein